MVRVAYVAFAAGVMAMSGAAAELSLASVFGDSMVLQRDAAIRVWGKASAGDRISVTVAGSSADAVADSDGAWTVELPSMQAGGPYELTATDHQRKIVLKDILIGDVWVCSGQSNMGQTVADTVRGADYAEADIAASDDAELRLFVVNPTIAGTPQDELASVRPWTPCTPGSVVDFSAAAYYFGRHLRHTTKAPIGLIMTAWGGTYAEAWTSEAGLATLPYFADRLADTRANLPRLDALEAEYVPVAEAWEAEMDALDAGVQGGVPVWSAPECPTADWESVDLPFPFAKLAGTDRTGLGGRIWFRRDVELPAAWAGRDLVLGLGLARETGRVWFNGTEVSRFDLVYRFWDGKAAQIPGSLVKAGVNTIVVRLTDSAGMGGLFAEPSGFRLTATAPDVEPRTVGVAGPWMMRRGMEVEQLRPRPVPPAYWPNNPNMPTVLYNAMVHPLVRMPIRGVIWYQGESNSGAAFEYRSLFPALIEDWRRAWARDDFPFLFVQIANFGAWQPQATEPRECTWAELREAQLMALSVPNTAMAVAIDIGDPDDIHPVNKRDVGIRLGLAAQAVAYGEDIEYSGPVYKSMEVNDGRVRLRFRHDDGLTVRGEALTGFAVAGEDRKFVYAEAEVQGDEVVVWSDAVPSPTAVRYGWDYAPQCNLYNAAGLPASPFRTDDWPGVTEPGVAAE